MVTAATGVVSSKIVVLRGELVWLERHATQQSDATWRCDASGAEIKTKSTRRSVWTQPPNGSGDEGAGHGDQFEVVVNIWCPSCQKEPDIKDGQGIYYEQLTLVDVGN